MIWIERHGAATCCRGQSSVLHGSSVPFKLTLSIIYTESLTVGSPDLGFSLDHAGLNYSGAWQRSKSRTTLHRGWTGPGLSFESFFQENRPCPHFRLQGLQKWWMTHSTCCDRWAQPLWPKIFFVRNLTLSCQCSACVWMPAWTWIENVIQCNAL